MLRLSLVGASGYVGGELLRWLSHHPRVRVVGLYATQDQSLHGLFPNLRKVVQGDLKALDPARLASESDVVLLSVPHGTSAPLAQELVAQGVRVLDLSGDLRLHDREVRRKYYGDFTGEAVFGLPERHRHKIKGARLVANPGCYPTAAILALLPLAEAGLVDGPLIVDAKSGVSGAGRGATATTHFCQVNENLRPYNLGIHRHQPEMEQELESPVFFSPHLVPMTRGILATCYARLKPGGTTQQHLTDLYKSRYAEEPFVRFLEGELPQTRATYGSNFCDVALHHDPEKGLVVAVAALDNLVKGAAGQAIQNLNLMFDLPETEGLWSPAILP